MSKNATELLNELQKKGLVPDEIIASLRTQVAKSSKPVAPQTITKLLVEKGHLTPPQAQKLLGAPATASKAAVTATATKQAAKAPAAVAAAATQSITDDLTSADGLEPLDALSPLDDLQPLDGLSPLDEPAPAALDALPDDDLFGGPLDADPLKAAQPAAAMARKPAGFGQPAPVKPRTPRSPVTTLLLAANGVALLVVLAAAALAFWPRATGDTEFQQAEAEFAAKNDAAAVEQYDLLLARFPQHPQAGLARVHRGLAKMRLAVGSNSDWAQLLPVAKQVLPEIDALPELNEIQAELAPLIANMAIGLAEQAAAVKTPEQLAAAKAALALANNGRYVKGNLRPWQQLALAEESLAVAEYQMAGSKPKSSEAAP
jgi:hypothetical protein